MVTGTVPEGSRAFAEVDEVETVERDSVDGEDAAIGVEIVLEDVIHQSCEVVMKTGQIGCGLQPTWQIVHQVTAKVG